MTLRLTCIALLFLSACTMQVEAPAVKPSNDFSGLTADERKHSEWVAFDVFVPAGVARSIRRWQLSNVTLQVFRCSKPDDNYPAIANLNGKLLSYEDLKEPLPPSVRMTFYVPPDSSGQEANVCAAFDARGYSPVFLRGEVVRLPPLRMTFPHYDKETGRFIPT